jgi:hypothetical protein
MKHPEFNIHQVEGFDISRAQGLTIQSIFAKA